MVIFQLLLAIQLLEMHLTVLAIQLLTIQLLMTLFLVQTRRFLETDGQNNILIPTVCIMPLMVKVGTLLTFERERLRETEMRAERGEGRGFNFSTFSQVLWATSG